MGLYPLGWLIFTFYLTIAAVRTNAAVLRVVITLTVTYLLLPLVGLRRRRRARRHDWLVRHRDDQGSRAAGHG